jgi:hypothetical protein
MRSLPSGEDRPGPALWPQACRTAASKRQLRGRSWLMTVPFRAGMVPRAVCACAAGISPMHGNQFSWRITHCGNILVFAGV